MNLKTALNVLFCVLLLSLTGLGQAQGLTATNPWLSSDPSDYSTRAVYHQYTTYGTQTSTADLASTGTIVSAFDVYASPTLTIPTASITQPLGPRTLGIRLFESNTSPKELYGKVTIRGIDAVGRSVSSVINFTTTKQSAVTGFAYRTINSIDIALEGEETGDLLNIGVYAYGLGVNPASLNTVVKNGAAVAAADYTWSQRYGTLLFDTAPTNGHVVTVWGYKSDYVDFYTGSENVTPVTSF